ncbi:Ankyrin repeat [Macleaya cordata]|uniref:Ankyrin repeat n=1 Tax=Macleaya cordata TaxID=56857 RepID=A0A200Q2V6_MACCD|nr:Ankyrin repeat [Macleaya cordata]
MERKVYEASLGGNVNSLMELLEEDPLVLDRSVLTGFYETPLHIAAMRGHVDFATKLLSIKPDLASELDSSHGFCPLHLASTKKDVEMVKVLLEANPDVCSVTDQDGRTPLHLAAMKGRVEIMKLLIQTRPETIQFLSDRRETILHLCVKHNRLDALKLLVEYLAGVPTDEESISVNSKDDDGNTILHLAVARRQMKMIKYLLLDRNIGVELNAINKKGFTAMDILTQSETRGLKDMEIEDLFQDAGAKLLRAAASRRQSGDKDIQKVQLVPWNKKSYDDEDEQYDKWLKQKQNTLMVVASLIAAMAFQGGLNPPGGLWQGNADEDRTYNTTNYSINENIHNGSPNTSTSPPSPFRLAGTSVMAQIKHDYYIQFMSFNTIGFLASLSIIFLLISGLHIKRKSFVGLLMGVLWVSITFMALTYLVAVTCLFSRTHHHHHHHQGDISSRPTAVTYTLLVWFGLLGLVLLVHIIRFISRLLGGDASWLLTKLEILKKKLNPAERSGGAADPSSII